MTDPRSGEVARPVLKISIACLLAFAVAACSGGGGGGKGKKKQSIAPCATNVVDRWQFDVVAGEAIAIRVDTVDDDTAADLCLTGSCPGDNSFVGDDEFACSFPPPQFGCPTASFSAEGLNTCRVNVGVCTDNCADATEARYEITVTADGDGLKLSLTADDDTGGPGVTIPTTTSTTTTTFLMSTTTTIDETEPTEECDITFSVVTDANYGALQFGVDYTAAGGNFVGVADMVDCTSLLGAQEIVTFNDIAACNLLNIGVLALMGFDGPAEVAVCRSRTRGVPVTGDFSIEVVDASTPAPAPIPDVMVEISDIDNCVTVPTPTPSTTLGPCATSTTTMTETTSSTSTTLVTTSTTVPMS